MVGLSIIHDSVQHELVVGVHHIFFPFLFLPLSPADIVFDVLPSQRPQDLCDFATLVTLDENLICHERECLVDTIDVLEVLPGVYL